MPHRFGLPTPDVLLTSWKISRDMMVPDLQTILKQVYITEMLNSVKWNSIELRNKELHLLTFYKIIYNCVNFPLPNDILTSLRATRSKFVQLALTLISSQCHSTLEWLT